MLLSAALCGAPAPAGAAPGGFEIVTGSPDELGLFAAKKTLKWAKAVKSAGIAPE